MKIGFDAKRAFHNTRGLGAYSRNLISGLLQYNNDIQSTLFTPALKNNPYIELIEKTKVVTPTGIWNLLPSAWRRRKISSLLKEYNLDIYHGLSHELPIGIENWSGKRVVTIHDLQYLKFPQNFSLIDRKIYHSKVLHACNVADVVIAICQQTKSDLINFIKVPEDKIVVHYQSCNSAYFPENALVKQDNEQFPYILNVAAFEPNKNQLSLLKAFKQIAHEIPHELHLIGSGGSDSYIKELNDYIQNNKLNKRVNLIQNISFENLVRAYKQSDIFCFPSFFEGFGIPVIEALFSGVPTIVSNTSSLPEVGGDAVKYIDPSSVDSIAESIKALYNCSNREDIVNKGIEQAQKFHLKETTKQLVKIYNN